MYAGNQPLLTLSSDPPANSTRAARVTGTVSYRQRIALTPDAVIEVKLLDVPRADAPSVTIAEQTIRSEGRQVPIPFEIPYDPGRIDKRRRYAIQVRILESEKVRFMNTRAYHVLTGGHPRVVDVTVSPVRQ